MSTTGTAIVTGGSQGIGAGLVTEGVGYARKLDAAEVEVTLVRYDSMIHDYCCFNRLSRVSAVRSALHQAAEELKRYLEE